MTTRGSTPVNTYGLFMDADKRALSRCHPKQPTAQPHSRTVTAKRQIKMLPTITIQLSRKLTHTNSEIPHISCQCLKIQGTRK